MPWVSMRKKLSAEYRLGEAMRDRAVLYKVREERCKGQ